MNTITTKEQAVLATLFFLYSNEEIAGYMTEIEIDNPLPGEKLKPIDPADVEAMVAYILNSSKEPKSTVKR
ncbi:hypothetical protein [Niabella aquatica]